MRLDGRRQSNNVDDRRGGRGMKLAGGGIGGIIVAALLVWISGGNPLSVLSGAAPELLGGGATEYVSSEEEEAYAVFAKQILAGTEDVWTEEFRRHGLTYQPPRMVLFSGAVQSACGGATSQTGPFYCSADQTVILTFHSSRRWSGAWIFQATLPVLML